MSFKKIKPGLLLVVLLTVAIAMSFNKISTGSVRGRVTPPEAGLIAFLFSGKDTVSVNVVSGAFQFSNIKAGNYRLLIEAAPPYRNAVKDGIIVADGQYTDAGQVELQK
ncbi:MAG: hypothetical protein ABI813_15975 [Bacteroidota bacterium]